MLTKMSFLLLANVEVQQMTFSNFGGISNAILASPFHPFKYFSLRQVSVVQFDLWQQLEQQRQQHLKTILFFN